MAKTAAVLMVFLLLCSCLTVRSHVRRETGSHEATGRKELSLQAPPERVTDKTAAYVRTPLESQRFWRTVMTPGVAARYKAKGSFTQCNTFIGDTLEKYFGPKVFARVFPNGVESPGVMYRKWRDNPDLARLAPEDASIETVQELADEGYLVLLVYRNDYGPGHLAFVGNSRLVMFTVPKITKLEGKHINDLEPAWLPVVVQAGAYSGVTSAAYASNGWLNYGAPLYNSGIVMFYLVRV